MNNKVNIIRRVGWPSKLQLQASLLSLGILSAALFLLWLGQWLQFTVEDKIEIREIAIATPPPPPPPPPTMEQPVVETPITLQVEGTGPSLETIKLEPTFTLKKPDTPIINTQQTQWQSLEIDWDALSLNDLDGLPSLLTQLRVTFPKSLSRKGVNKVLVKLDVVIDEQGKLTLVNIVENPHPELVSEIQRLVRSTRFTPPQKDNQPARARFIWPVEIEA